MANVCEQNENTIRETLQRHAALIRFFFILLAEQIFCVLQAKYKCNSDCRNCDVHDELVLKGLVCALNH